MGIPEEKLQAALTSFQNHLTLQKTDLPPSPPYFRLDWVNKEVYYAAIDPMTGFDLHLPRKCLVEAGIADAGRENWKSCVRETEEEKKEAKATKKALKPFDFTQI